jgi:hypothetical protein
MTVTLFGLHKHTLDQGGTENNIFEEPLRIHPFSMRELAENSWSEATLEDVNIQGKDNKNNDLT